MKPSTIALAAVLLVASATATDNNKTPKTTQMLKKRRVLQDDTMSLDTGATLDLNQPNSFGDWYKAPECATPKGKTCNGFEYYKILTGPDLSPVNNDAQISFTTFLEATPENCILAPVTSQADFAILQAKAGELIEDLDGAGITTRNLWVGINKATADVLNDNGGNGSTDNWFNLDGTSVPDVPALWASGEPNNSNPANSPGSQEFAHMRFDGSNTGLLRDLQNGGNSGPGVNSAIYKCCFDRVINFPTCDTHYD